MTDDRGTIRAALSCIPSYDRETWVRIGMAIKAELGEEGFDLWDAWSEQADSYSERDARDVWRSIHENGNTTIATLFHEAKRYGFNGECRSQPPKKDELARRERQRQADEAEREKRCTEAACKAKAIWKVANPLHSLHPYVVGKRINPVPTLRLINGDKATTRLGYAPKAKGDLLTGALIVVPVKIGDRLSTLEFIDEEGRKTALSGGAKAGGYWAAQPLPEGDGQDVTLAVGEGVATVLSVQQATGYLAVAALSCGNLARVTKDMRARYPAAEIIVLADRGEGQAKAEHAARLIGARLAVPDFGAERPDGATDFNDLARHRGLDAVREAIARATAPTNSEHDPEPDNAPADAVDAAAIIARLAGLSPIQYDRCREQEAKALGVRASTLDAEVSRLRRESNGDAEAGAAVLFHEPEPWPDPVDGAELLEGLAATFTRYLVLPAGAADALALWTMHTHVYDAFEHTPRLNVTAPVRGCGKTLALDVLQVLVAKGLRTENVSTAVLFRITESETPCLLVDEYDSFLRDNEDLRGALNAGHKRGGQHLRCEGDQNKVRAFRTFAPVALAGIGSLPGTLADRSIIIRMERAKPGELRERFDSRKTQREHELKRQLIRWSDDNRERLSGADPELPGLFNRRADNWRPLFAIAEVAGTDWPERVKAAVTALTDKSDENESAGVLLLADIRQLFETTKTDKLASTFLVDRLVEMEERPWPEFRRGKPITARQIASLLRPFGIVSGARREGGTVFRGYELRQFSSAFGRYLADSSVTALQPAFQSHYGDISSVTNDEHVTHTKTPKPASQLRCNAVTDRKAGNGARVWTKPEFTIIEGGQAEPWSMRI